MKMSSEVELLKVLEDRSRACSLGARPIVRVSESDAV